MDARRPPRNAPLRHRYCYFRYFATDVTGHVGVEARPNRYERFPPGPVRLNAAARNVFAALRPLFAWAHDEGHIEVNPIAGMKGPAPLKSRDRVLSDDEIAAFWRATKRLGGMFAPIFQLVRSLASAAKRSPGCAGMNLTSIKQHGPFPASVAKTASPTRSIACAGFSLARPRALSRQTEPFTQPSQAASV
jgi:hypothetical protein